MLERGRGSIVNVASNAAFQPSPYFAVYSAAKAFVLNFGLALRQEYRGRGIRVLTLCPGPVETAFFETIGTRRAAVTGSMTTPAPVVRAALRALERDRGYVAPGLSNALTAHLTPRRPRTLVAAIAERITRKVLAPLGVRARPTRVRTSGGRRVSLISFDVPTCGCVGGFRLHAWRRLVRRRRTWRRDR